MDIGSIYGILAMFTNILATEEKKLVAPDLLKKYKFSRNLEIAVAVIFLFSAIPEFWILNLRYFFWATTFFVFRGGGILERVRVLGPAPYVFECLQNSTCLTSQRCPSCHEHL